MTLQRMLVMLKKVKRVVIKDYNKVITELDYERMDGTTIVSSLSRLKILDKEILEFSVLKNGTLQIVLK